MVKFKVVRGFKDIEQLVDLVMQSNDMNHVYVLPQLHTLLWSNKKGV